MSHFVENDSDDTASLAMMYNAASSASVADDMTFFDDVCDVEDFSVV